MNEHSQNDELSSTSFQTRARYISALSNISVQYNLGVISSDIGDFENSKNSLDMIAQTVCVPKSSGPVSQHPVR